MRKPIAIILGLLITYFDFGNFSVLYAGEIFEPKPIVVSVVEKKKPEVVVLEEETVVEIQNEYIGEYRVTAYCSCEKCCDEWANNRPVDENGNEIVIGASGEVLISGYSVAVDPKVIPYGTILIIDGTEYIAADCGGAIKGKRIDLYFDSHQEALEWGIQYKDVYLKNGGN